VSVYAWIACVSALVSALGALVVEVRLSKVPKLRSLLSRVEGLETELSEMGALLKRIDARDRMRAVRSAKTDQTDSSSPTKENAPDPIREPLAWKRYMQQHHPAHLTPHKGSQ